VIERDPASFDQPVQGWVQGPLFYLEHIVRCLADGFHDGVAVRWPQQKRFQNQQI
jgi:hypothetical protein